MPVPRDCRAACRRGATLTQRGVGAAGAHKDLVDDTVEVGTAAEHRRFPLDAVVCVRAARLLLGRCINNVPEHMTGPNWAR